MKNIEIQLLKKLQSFGLQPNDWRLSKRPDHRIEIQNRRVQGFSFLGTSTIKNGHADWKHIQLLSL